MFHSTLFSEIYAHNNHLVIVVAIMGKKVEDCKTKTKNKNKRSSQQHSHINQIMTPEKIKNVSELSPQPEECVLQYNSVTKPSREKKKKNLNA